jgi:uncharacterized protein (DUF885 family)
MGLFLDEYERLGMLEAQAHRASRLIVDSGMHALGWDRERAIRQVMDGGTPRSESEIEVDRYISWPGQALSYKLGEIAIVRLRAQAEQELGDRFDVKAFHDAVLSQGSVPLPVLEEQIQAFIAQRKAAAS